MQGDELLASASGHDFDVAVLAIAHPSGDVQLRGFALHEPAEADALDASGHNEAARVEIRHKEVASDQWLVKAGREHRSGGTADNTLARKKIVIERAFARGGALQSRPKRAHGATTKGATAAAPYQF